MAASWVANLLCFAPSLPESTPALTFRRGKRSMETTRSVESKVPAAILRTHEDMFAMCLTYSLACSRRTAIEKASHPHKCPWRRPPHWLTHAFRLNPRYRRSCAQFAGQNHYGIGFKKNLRQKVHSFHPECSQMSIRSMHNYPSAQQNSVLKRRNSCPAGRLLGLATGTPPGSGGTEGKEGFQAIPPFSAPASAMCQNVYCTM